jgi:hypothetical protein
MGGTPHTPDGFVAPRDLARQLGMSKGLLDGFVRRGDLHVTRCGRWRLIPLAEAAAFTAWIARQMPPPDRPRGAYCRDVPGGRCACRCHALRRSAGEDTSRERRWNAWLPEHDAYVRRLVGHGVSPEAIAERISARFKGRPRTPLAVRQRIRKLDLSMRAGWMSGEDLMRALGIYRRRIAQYEAQGLLTNAPWGRWRRYADRDIDALIRAEAGITIDPRRVRDPRLKALAETSASVNRRQKGTS